MRAVTDASFERDVLRSPRPVVVDFWAPWCRPCDAVTATLEQLGSDHATRIDVVGLDVDANPGTAARYGVLTLPTAILFEAGEAREEVLGARNRAHYERAWARWLTRPGSDPSP
jgi:thioredoxin 1